MATQQRERQRHKKRQRGLEDDDENEDKEDVRPDSSVVAAPLPKTSTIQFLQDTAATTDQEPQHVAAELDPPATEVHVYTICACLYFVTKITW